MVKGLHAVRNNLLGRKIRIYDDHNNMPYFHSTNPQNIRWRMAKEEISPELHYIEEDKNIVPNFHRRYPV